MATTVKHVHVWSEPFTEKVELYSANGSTTGWDYLKQQQFTVAGCDKTVTLGMEREKR